MTLSVLESVDIIMVDKDMNLPNLYCTHKLHKDSYKQQAVDHD